MLDTLFIDDFREAECLVLIFEWNSSRVSNRNKHLRGLFSTLPSQLFLSSFAFPTFFLATAQAPRWLPHLLCALCACWRNSYLLCLSPSFSSFLVISVFKDMAQNSRPPCCLHACYFLPAPWFLLPSSAFFQRVHVLFISL